MRPALLFSRIPHSARKELIPTKNLPFLSALDLRQERKEESERVKFENLRARGLHEQQFYHHLRVTAESVSEHDQSETESMAFPIVRGHSVQLRQRVYPSLHEREIFACGIQNPGLWNPESKFH